ncbi:MAG: hypothetical protein WCI73_01975 [Phycisphaerae bacterium]
MRPRMPNFLWIPFVFSIEGLSWTLLGAALALLAAVIITPAIQDLREAQADRNNVQATVDLLDQKLALQKDFIKVASTDPLLMERLAGRQLRLVRADQEMLVLDPASLHKDMSTTGLLAESLQPVQPRSLEELPWYLQIPKFMQPFLNQQFRRLALLAACVGLLLAFVLGIRFDKSPAR